MSFCVRHTDLPNTSKLFADFVYAHDRVAPFYEGSPMVPESYDAAVARLDYPDDRRAAMAAILRKLNGESQELALFEKPGTVAVVTGQQVGLFSGPCYTIYKALTAARLTETLNARGIPAVTIFWLASEDHDFAEVRQAWGFGPGIHVGAQQVDSGTLDPVPVGDVAPSTYPVAELRALIGELPFGAEIAALVEETYKPGATMSAAFMALLRRLLPDSGLLFVDPMCPGVREIAAPLIEQAIEESARLSARLIERNRELESAGYHAQVHFEAKTSLFFLLEHGMRTTLRYDGEGWVQPGARFSRGEMRSRAASISPNALLRPVVQDYILPSVAQIGGPAEIAYLAQTQVLYEGLGRRGPVVAPRAGFTILDARAAKLMERYALALPHFYDGIEPLRQRVAEKLAPPAVRRSLDDTGAAVGEALDSLSGVLRGFDTTLAESAQKSLAKMRYQLSKVRLKTERAALRKDERAAAEAAYLYSLIFPEKHLQERLYTILPFLALHGMGLIERVYERVRLECPDHIVITV